MSRKKRVLIFGILVGLRISVLKIVYSHCRVLISLALTLEKLHTTIWVVIIFFSIYLNIDIIISSLLLWFPYIQSTTKFCWFSCYFFFIMNSPVCVIRPLPWTYRTFWLVCLYPNFLPLIYPSGYPYFQNTNLIPSIL